jgi:hypothetical protein
MPEVNLVGDVVLTDPRAMRVLADASRLALHDLLRPHGPATADELAPLFEPCTPSLPSSDDTGTEGKAGKLRARSRARK